MIQGTGTLVSQDEFHARVLQRQKDYCAYCASKGYILDVGFCDVFIENMLQVPQEKTDWYLYPDGTHGCDPLKDIYTDPTTIYLCTIGRSPVADYQCVETFRKYIDDHMKLRRSKGSRVFPKHLTIHVCIPLVFTPNWSHIACWVGIK